MSSKLIEAAFVTKKTVVTRQHKTLSNAKSAKNDEFYTQLSDIENELKHYKAQFKDKIVFCNCDDAYESNFFKYFALNFKELGLKKLMATSYSDTQPMYKIEITNIEDLNGDGAVNLDDIKVLIKNGGVKTLLRQNGDFRSDECIKLLKEADIVCTNPPFSLFREYVAQLVEYGKKFLIIGNMNAITYKEVFKLIKDEKLWMGYNFNKSFLFGIPDDYERYHHIEDGKKYGLVPAICWFTNLDVNKRHENITLYKKYIPEEYPKYDNYDAIEVSKVADIPMDYDGVMGVPITFLGRHNPEQFKIVGQGQGNLYRELTEKGLNAKFVDDYYKGGGKGFIKENHPVLGYYDNKGKATIPYMRILIRRKQ